MTERSAHSTEPGPRVERLLGGALVVVRRGPAAARDRRPRRAARADVHARHPPAARPMPMLIAALALSYHVLFGTAGLLSFGHALFFAVGRLRPRHALELRQRLAERTLFARRRSALTLVFAHRGWPTLSAR